MIRSSLTAFHMQYLSNVFEKYQLLFMIFGKSSYIFVMSLQTLLWTKPEYDTTFIATSFFHLTQRVWLSFVKFCVSESKKG